MYNYGCEMIEYDDDKLKFVVKKGDMIVSCCGSIVDGEGPLTWDYTLDNLGYNPQKCFYVEKVLWVKNAKTNLFAKHDNIPFEDIIPFIEEWLCL